MVWVEHTRTHQYSYKKAETDLKTEEKAMW